METEKSKIQTKHVVSYILMILIIGVLAYRINTLNQEKRELAKKEILTEYKLLNSARIGEYSKSMTTIKLLECKGVKRDVLDSITLHLFISNINLVKRDSAYITERYRALK